MGCIPSKQSGTASSQSRKQFLPIQVHLRRRSRRNGPQNPETPLPYTKARTLHEKQKMERLQTDGLVVVIDQSNIEIEGRRIAGQNPPENAEWALSYPNLLNLIARKGNLQSAPRPLLSTYCMTSETQRFRNHYVPSHEAYQREGIALTVPSSRNITLSIPSHEDPAATRKEKAVDHTLVRVMTQEFEGIQLLHNIGFPRPDRTFCLVAGDFDYIDVVEQARLSGCNVEIWFWVQRDAMSRQWERELSKRHDELGSFSTHDIEPQFEYLSEWRPSQRKKSGRSPKAQRNTRSTESTPRPSPRQRQLRLSQAPEVIQLPATPRVRRRQAREGKGGTVESGNVGFSAESSETGRCIFREFCNRKRCVGAHTEKEMEHFESNGGRGKYILAKQKLCAGQKVHEANIERDGICCFIHEGELPLCVTCLDIHARRECEIERHGIIGKDHAKRLLSKGYLVRASQDVRR